MAALLLLSLCIFAGPKNVSAALTPQVLQLVQSDSTGKSISVAWAVANTEQIEVWIKESLPANKNNYRKVATVTTNGYTFTDLRPGTTYDIMIVAINGIGTTDVRKTTRILYSAKTSMDEVGNVYQKSWDRFTNTLEIGWDKVSVAEGYEIYFETSGEKKLENKTVGRDIDSVTFHVENNRVYKFSLRAFTTEKGVKKYTHWKSIYCLEQPWIKSVTKANGKLNVKWQKVKGAQGYDVYVSSKPYSGYKKVKSVKKSKNSVTIKKVGKTKIKKKKTWYVYVEAKRDGNTSGRKYFFSSKTGGQQYTAF